MSIVITTGDKSKEYFLNQVGSVCCGGNGGTTSNGLYLVDGKIVDGNANDVTETLDTILAESTVAGDMIIDYGDLTGTNTTE